MINSYLYWNLYPLFTCSDGLGEIGWKMAGGAYSGFAGGWEKLFEPGTQFNRYTRPGEFFYQKRLPAFSRQISPQP